MSHKLGLFQPEFYLRPGESTYRWLCDVGPLYFTDALDIYGSHPFYNGQITSSSLSLNETVYYFTKIKSFMLDYEVDVYSDAEGYSLPAYGSQYLERAPGAPTCKEDMSQPLGYFPIRLGGTDFSNYRLFINQGLPEPQVAGFDSLAEFTGYGASWAYVNMLLTCTPHRGSYVTVTGFDVNIPFVFAVDSVDEVSTPISAVASEIEYFPWV